jgi:hypothetical protein
MPLGLIDPCFVINDVRIDLSGATRTYVVDMQRVGILFIGRLHRAIIDATGIALGRPKLKKRSNVTISIK